MPKEIVCCVCSKRCNPKCRRKVSGKLKKYVKRVICRELYGHEIICSSCTGMYYKHSKSSDSEVITSLNSQTCNNGNIQSFSSPKTVNLKIRSTARTHKYCIVCNKYGSKSCRLVLVPGKARTQAFIETGIFIDSLNRCCRSHIDDEFFNTISLSLLKGTKKSDVFSRTEITELLHNVRSLMKSSFHLNFDIPSLLSDDDYLELTSLTKDQFADVVSYLSSVRNTAVRSIRTCLAILLVKLKTGLSNKFIAVLFGLKKSQVQRSVHSARVALIEHFVPNNLGFNHISHSNFCEEHTSIIAKELFSVSDGQAIVVLDGTYIYIQKSGNYKFQRRSYSLYKHRPLVKPMVIVGTDGYILSVLGPYLADGKNNDAAITKHVFSSNLQNINQWFAAGDLCIVDRGFRDSVSFLEDQGYRVEMPTYLSKGNKQHTASEANLSRLITKVRWIVESVNGRIKQYKMMDKVIPNTYIQHIGGFVDIICSLLNKYRRPLLETNPASEEMARNMLHKSKQDNELFKYLEQENLLNKRSVYSPIELSNGDIESFPILSLDDLRSITFGVYQIKQAPFYSKEHLSDDGDYQLFLCKENAGLLKIKIQSRHSNSSKHSLWIQFDESVKGWYCTCKVGARVVGCCAHIASVLWYLGFSRHQGNLAPTNQAHYNAILDASEVPSTDNSDNSDMEE